MKINFFYSIFLIVTFFVTLSCGGGGTSVSTPISTTTEITGLQGDMNAIEPIDLD